MLHPTGDVTSPALWHSGKVTTMEIVNISGFQELGMGRDKREELREILGNLKYSVWYIIFDVCHYTFFQSYRMYNSKSEPQCKHGL